MTLVSMIAFPAPVAEVIFVPAAGNATPVMVPANSDVVAGLAIRRGRVTVVVGNAENHVEREPAGACAALSSPPLASGNVA